MNSINQLGLRAPQNCCHLKELTRGTGGRGAGGWVAKTVGGGVELSSPIFCRYCCLESVSFDGRKSKHRFRSKGGGTQRHKRAAEK